MHRESSFTGRCSIPGRVKAHALWLVAARFEEPTRSTEVARFLEMRKVCMDQGPWTDQNFQLLVCLLAQSVAIEGVTPESLFFFK